MNACKCGCGQHAKWGWRYVAGHNPTAGMNDSQRFWARFDDAHLPPELCWIWPGGYANGYGVFTIQKKNVQAHRFAYEDMRAEIPPGLNIDHLCSVRGCVNPWHLEPVTQAVNVMRAQRKPACPKGHPRTEENTYRYRNQMRCRPCKSAAKRRANAKQRQLHEDAIAHGRLDLTWLPSKYQP